MVERLAQGLDGGGALGVVEAEEAGELLFEVEHGAQVRVVGFQVIEPASEQGRQVWNGGGGFGYVFEQLDEVGSGEHAGPGGAQTEAVAGDVSFAKRVQVGPPTGCIRDVGAEKEIEPTGQRALRAEGPFGHGFDQPMVLRAPCDDQAGFGQPDASEQGGVGCDQRVEERWECVGGN